MGGYLLFLTRPPVTSANRFLKSDYIRSEASQNPGDSFRIRVPVHAAASVDVIGDDPQKGLSLVEHRRLNSISHIEV